MRRLLTISHSYSVALNRAVPNAIADLGWEVTVVAPRLFRGEFGDISAGPSEGERARLELVPMRWSRQPHLRHWTGALRERLLRPWDVVHVWEEPYTLAGAQVARWHRAGALVFATFQNIGKRYPPPLGWFERAAMRRASGWIAFGRTVEAALARRPPYVRVPYRVIPPAVDLSSFREDPADRLAVRRELGLAPEDFVVGYAGRFVAAKGLTTLMDALDRAREDRVDWRALLVGGGPREHDLRRWAARHDGRVRILTGVAHARMARYLRAMDLLALPSRTARRWREQFGRVLVEAMACGVPVVGSDSGEIPYVIGEAGLIVPEGDVRTWSEAIASLASDRSGRERLRQRGAARARRFDAAAAAREHVAFYEELLA